MKKINIKYLFVFCFMGIILSLGFLIYRNRKAETTENKNTAQEVKYTPEFIVPSVSWNSSLNDYVPEKYKAEIEPIRKAIQEKYKTALVGDKYLAIDGVLIFSQWLKLDGTPYYRESNEMVPSEGSAIYGEKLTSGWKLYSPGEEGFCGYAKRAPKDWVDPFFLEDCK